MPDEEDADGGGSCGVWEGEEGEEVGCSVCGERGLVGEW